MLCIFQRGIERVAVIINTHCIEGCTELEERKNVVVIGQGTETVVSKDERCQVGSEWSLVGV